MIPVVSVLLLHLAIIHRVVLNWQLIIKHGVWKQKFCLGLEKKPVFQNHFSLLSFIYKPEKVVVLVVVFITHDRPFEGCAAFSLVLLGCLRLEAFKHL